MADQVSPDPAQQAMQDLAAEVLSKEQAAPGSQDPEYVRWATSRINGGQAPAPVSPVSTPLPPTAPVQAQPPQPAATPVTQGDETVLQIQQTPGQTIQPTENVIKPNNGQGAA